MTRRPGVKGRFLCRIPFRIASTLDGMEMIDILTQPRIAFDLASDPGYGNHGLPIRTCALSFTPASQKVVKIFRLTTIRADQSTPRSILSRP